jgi:hypothetical protein
VVPDRGFCAAVDHHSPRSGRDRLGREAVLLCSVTITVVGAAALAVPAVRRLERTDLPTPAAVSR